MTEKEAIDRLEVLHIRQPFLEKEYSKYVVLYNTHIKPLMPAVREYWNSSNEIRKLEHFLKELAYERQKEGVKKEKLPYAPKSSAGKSPKQAESDAVKAFKQLTPEQQAILLKKLGG